MGEISSGDRSGFESLEELVIRHTRIVISHMGMIAELERAVHLIAAHIERAAADLGVTQAEAHVLAQLHRHGPQTVGELQHGFGHKRSTLTNVLDRLDLRGLIERRLNPHDRRSFIVALTREGARAAGHVTLVIETLEEKLAKEVTRRDLEGVRAVANALARLADAGE
jgi:DNA-binding MarR family transcriptional regulator